MYLLCGCCSYLGLAIVIKLVSDKGVESIPVLLQEVASDRPNVAKDKRCADQHMQLDGVSVHVRATPCWEEQGFQQFAQCHHFADIHLHTQHNAMNTQHAAMNTQRAAMNIEHTEINTQHTVMNTQHTAMNTSHTAMNTQHTAVNTQNTAMNTTHSAT